MQHATSSRDTKTAIHRAALELFSGQGYEKTSLREIAEQVGITKASLYYHYSSKQDLLRAIIGTFVDDVRAVMATHRRTGVVAGGPARRPRRVHRRRDQASDHRPDPDP